MPKTPGKLCIVKRGATTIAGARVTGINWNGEAIDITDQASNGVQTFLTDHLASDVLEITIEGMEEDSQLHDRAFSNDPADKFIADVSFNFPSGNVVSGPFFLANYSETGDYKEATTFSAKFIRNGAHTFTEA
ncbi:MAG: hypothetical protein GY947_07485 [Rhodobacteraceae bacterium]|nr:hypothetical protein [Paracoccaceae bacterium]